MILFSGVEGVLEINCDISANTLLVLDVSGVAIEFGCWLKLLAAAKAATRDPLIFCMSESIPSARTIGSIRLFISANF